MGDIHDDLREVMGLLENYCIAKARKSSATSDEYQRFKNASADFMLAHGPALITRQEGEWLPIESAPKDRPVIITNGDAVGEASYHESDGGWWWAGYHPTDAADGYVWQPSHWRPLPALPAARSGGGG